MYCTTKVIKFCFTCMMRPYLFNRMAVVLKSRSNDTLFRKYRTGMPEEGRVHYNGDWLLAFLMQFYGGLGLR